MGAETPAEPAGSKKVLGLFALAMINVAAVLSIRNFPSMAVYGWSCIGWYVIGAVLFLVPISLAGAELATGWPQGGGVYAWVKQAFGEKGGFVALFCEWSNNLVWFPTVLSFVASTLAFALTPSLAASPWYMFSVMMIAFWGTTAIACFGEEASTKFGNAGVILGSIIPAILIILLGIWWIGSGQALVLPPFTPASVIPSIDLSTLPFFATIILLFAGMEMAGFHALETKNPQKDFPRAMALSAVIIVACTVLATLAIAVVIPAGQLNLASGVMQAIQYFFTAAGMPGLVAPMAILITLGGIVSLAAWLIGPAKGLGIVAEEGNMPPLFDRTNRYGAPVAVLLIQALIGSAISLLYVFLPSVNQAYWILSAMTVELLCIVYILVFASVIKLRYSQPDTPRPFRIPGGMAGVWVVGGLGLAGTVFAFVVGLMPPSYFASDGIVYIGAVLLGTFFLAVPPLVFLKYRKPSWLRAPGEVRRDERAILCVPHWKAHLGKKASLEHALAVFLVIMFLLPCGLLIVASKEAGFFPVSADPAAAALQQVPGIVVTGVSDTRPDLPGALGGKVYTLSDNQGNHLTLATQAFDSTESRDAAIRLFNAHPVGKGRHAGSLHPVGQYLVYASPSNSPILEKIAPVLDAERTGISGSSGSPK